MRGERAGQAPRPEEETPKPRFDIDREAAEGGDEFVELDIEDLEPVDEEPVELGEEDVDVLEGPPPLPTPEARERRERERAERKMLLDALSTEGLEPDAALEIIAAYDAAKLGSELDEEVEAVVRSYGLEPSRMAEDERKRLAVMYLGATRGKDDERKRGVAEAMEGAMRERLAAHAFENLDALQAAVERSRSVEELKGSALETMRSLHALSRQLPREMPGAEGTWKEIHDRFQRIVYIRKNVEHPGVRQALSEIFDQFSDFIEDDLIAYKMSQGRVEVEKAMQELYGRSKEEVEELKSRNRAEVAAEISRIAKEEHGVTIAMIERLHALYNKGIVPKRMSKLREDPDTIMTFGSRVGLMGDDIRPEMDKLIDRADLLMDIDASHGVSGPLYAIEAARLHNDLLDMHPFPDRNGSTALLFLELLMAKKGYEPSPEREKDYYRHLGRVLGQNPAAIAVVGYEQYKIKYEYGYYEGETVKADPEKKAKYEKILAMWRGVRGAAKKKEKKGE